MIPLHKETKVLLDVPVSEWRTPSQAQPKDMFGNENKTVFTVSFGDLWHGTFYDREDFDAFLWSYVRGLLRYERPLWNLPDEVWQDPRWDIRFAETMVLNTAVSTYLTSPTGSNQTYTVPTDWNSASNTVQTIGGGASGGAVYNAGGGAYCGMSGGGGGAWNQVTNLTFAHGASVTYQIAATAAARAATNGAGLLNGNNGTDTWFNGANIGASSVGSKGGTGGVGSSGAPGNFTGSAGGTGASGVGSSSNNGGRAGTYSGTNVGGSIGTGGGGAATSAAAGSAGGDTGSINGHTNGGASGSGASGGTGSSTTPAGNGGNGTEMGSSRGGGGGGGGYDSTSVGTGTAGTGGNYGGGGGGAATNAAAGGTVTSGIGAQGIIYVSYNPIYKYHTNLAMMGM